MGVFGHMDTSDTTDTSGTIKASVKWVVSVPDHRLDTVDTLTSGHADTCMCRTYSRYAKEMA